MATRKAKIINLVNRRSRFVRLSTLMKASGKKEQGVRTTISKFKLGKVKDHVLMIDPECPSVEMKTWLVA